MPPDENDGPGGSHTSKAEASAPGAPVLDGVAEQVPDTRAAPPLPSPNGAASGESVRLSAVMAANEELLAQEGRSTVQAITNEWRRLRDDALTELKQERDRVHTAHKALADERADWEREQRQQRLALDAELNAERERKMQELRKQLEDLRGQEEQRLQKEETKRRGDLDEECRRRRGELEEELQKRKATVEREIVADQERLREAETKLKDAEEKLALDRVKLDADRKRHERTLREDTELLKEDRELLEARVRLKVDAGMAKERTEHEVLRTQLASVREKRDDLEKKLHEREEADRRFGSQSKQEILHELDLLKEKCQKQADELVRRMGTEQQARLEFLEKRCPQLEQQVSELTDRCARLDGDLARAKTGVTQLEKLRDQCEAVEARNQGLLKLKEGLQREYDELMKRYTSLTQHPQEIEARMGVIEEPLSDYQRFPAPPHSDEKAWLDQVVADITHAGFTFPRRLVDAFHTSLKIAEWAPLTVLAGVSGTGKSALPLLYARFGGVFFEPIAVQPNWDTTQDLFGMFNYLDNRFNAKRLLRAMAQSQRAAADRAGTDDSMLLVLLDEMNLARVELYFSDLLSKLELRREEPDRARVEIDLGSGLAKYELPLGDNVLFVGTMNEDETTHALSDKTLDRSNVITFPRPRALLSRDEVKRTQQKATLSRERWKTWHRSPRDLDTLIENFRQPYHEAVERINNHLEVVGRALGHRVWQAMEQYIANHPRVCAALNSGDTGEFTQAAVMAFEDQLVQKVMPKLRGVETDGPARMACLQPISEVLRERAPGLAEDYQAACKSSSGAFVWRGTQYLEGGE